MDRMGGVVRSPSQAVEKIEVGLVVAANDLITEILILEYLRS